MPRSSPNATAGARPTHNSADMTAILARPCARPILAATRPGPVSGRGTPPALPFLRAVQSATMASGKAKRLFLWARLPPPYLDAGGQPVSPDPSPF